LGIWVHEFGSGWWRAWVWEEITHVRRRRRRRKKKKKKKNEELGMISFSF
jgi:hypothetical protein